MHALHRSLLGAPLLFASIASAQSSFPDFSTYASGSYTLELDGRSTTIQLRGHEVRTGDFRVAIVQENGLFAEMPAPLARTVRGSAADWPSLAVAGSLTEDGAELIATDFLTGDSWEINSDPDFTALQATPIPTPKEIEGFCGVDHEVDYQSVSTTEAVGFANFNIVEVMVDTDTEFLTSHGNSFSAAIAYAENVMNLASQRFEFSTNVELAVVGVLLRPFTNTFNSTSPNTLLGSVESFWDARPDRPDLVHLLSGKDLDGTVIGVAFIDGICTTNGIGLSQTVGFSQSLVPVVIAHEIGHNLNQQHCDGSPQCNIMCSSISACGPTNSFAPQVAASISNVSNNRSCIDFGPSLSPPIIDSTSAGTFNDLDRNVWQRVYAARAFTDSALGTGRAVRIGKQSSVLGIPLEETPVQGYVETAELDLGGFSLNIQAKLYANFTQAGGVMRFEYRDLFGNWVPFFTPSSSQLNNGNFVTMPLPPGAHLDGSDIFSTGGAIRIINNSFVSDDFIYIREFSISGVPCGDISTLCSPPNPNSVHPNGATLFADGTRLSSEPLELSVSNLPFPGFGYYAMGDASPTPITIGNGILCIGGPGFFRFPSQNTANDPLASRTVSGAFLAARGVDPGETWHFQYFYRDFGPVSDFSSAVSITFCP